MNPSSAIRYTLAGLLLALFASRSFGGPGDMAIYRASPGGEVITPANFDHDWNVTERVSGDAHALDADDVSIKCEAGHHLVMYSVRFDDTSGGANNRSEFQSQLRLDGADVPIGWSQGYIRRDQNQYECLTAGGGIIDVAVNDDVVSLRSFRSDANSFGAMRYSGEGGIQLLKLDDTWDYCRLSKSGDQTGSPDVSTWVSVKYDVQDELDTGSFGHTSVSSNITLKTAGHYLVLANTYFETTLNLDNRTIMTQRLTLDGNAVTGSWTTVYLRGDANLNSCNDGATSIGMILETTGANQDLNVAILKDCGDTATIKSGRTAITIVKLPDTADYVRLDDGATEDFYQASPVAIGWDTEVEFDASSFTHADSQVGVRVADEYLFMMNVYDPNDNVERGYFWQRWRVNGTTIKPYGQTGRYSRNTGGADAVGNWSGVLLDLDSGDYVQTLFERLGNLAGNLNAENQGLQGVRLGSLFSSAMPVAPGVPVTVGLKMWLKADAITGLSDGDAITNWVDSSGLGNAVTQSTAGVQPTFETSVLNGKPVVRFDGADDRLERDDALGLPATTNNPAMTVIVVAKVDTLSGALKRIVCLGENVTTGGRTIGFCADASTRYNDGNMYWGNHSFLGGFKIGAWTCAEGETYGETKYYRDGVGPVTEITSGGTANVKTLSDQKLRIGGKVGQESEFFDGDIAEVIVYDRVLTAEELEIVGVYLEGKYALDTSYGNAPGDVPGLALWLDADRLGLTNNAEVTQWTDFSTNANHATNSAGPTFIASAPGGRAAVSFDGSGGLFTGTLTADWPTSSASVFIVSMADNTTQQTRLFQAQPDETTNRFGANLPYNDAAYFDVGDRTGDGRVTTTFNGGTAFNVWHLRTEDGVGQAIYRNGMLEASDTTTDTFAVTGQVLKVADNFVGDIAEVIIYNRALSGTEARELGDYLATKYDLETAYTDSDSVPQSIGGLKLWLDYDNMPGVTNGAQPTTIYDASGNDNNLVIRQGAPTFYTNGVNGRSYMHYGGGGVYERQDALGFSGSPALSVVAVVRADSTAAMRMMQLGGSGGGGGTIMSFGLESSVRYNDGNRVYDDNFSGDVSIGVWTREQNDSYVAARLFKNGLELATAGSGDGTLSLSDQWLMVGRGWSGAGVAGETEWANMYLYELLVFDKALTYEEQNELGAYLAAKYGLATTYTGGFDPSAYSHSMALTFPGCDRSETLHDFPVLVALDEAIDGFEYDQFASINGYDLRFTDSTGTELLSHDIDEWHTNGTSYVWVRIPDFTSDTSIKAYWGASTEPTEPPFSDVTGGTWDDDYLGVWHLGTGDGGGAAADATVNGIDGAVDGNAFRTAAYVGSGMEFDGVDDGIDLGDVDEMDTPTEFTFSTWFRRRNNVTTASNHAITNCLIGQSSDENDNFELGLGNGTVDTYIDDAGADGSPDRKAVGILDNTWQHLAFTYDATRHHEAFLYIDGVFASSWDTGDGGGGLASSAGSELSFGIARPNNEKWGELDGWMDEARISLVPRSEPWLATEYAMMADQSTFVSFAKTLELEHFDHRMKIQFAYDKGETLTNFPVLVKLEEGTNFKYSDCLSAQGYDLRVMDDDGTGASLAYEIEKWNTNGTSFVWVNVPSFTNDCAIWMGWGKAGYDDQLPCTTNGAVWNADYRGVWHMAESSGAHSDATTNAIDSTGMGVTDQDADGRVAGADRFDGVDDYVAFNHGSKLNISGPMTYEAIVRWDGGGDGYSRVFCNNPDANYFEIHVNDASANGLYRTRYKVATANTVLAPGYTVTAGQWCHLAVVWDGTARRMYADGVEVGSDAQGPGDSGNGTMYLGSDFATTQNNFQGIIDEARVSSVGRSSNWLWAAHQIVEEYEAFVTHSPQVRADAATSIASDSATANGELVWTGGTNMDVTLYYGTADPGAAPGGWDSAQSIGTGLAAGSTLTYGITGLLRDTTYHYRFHATDGENEAWSEVESFRTLFSDISGLSLWVNADAILNTTNGQTVSTWEDLSGNDNDLASYWQGAPVLATNVSNGRSAIRFDGSDSTYYAFNRISDIRTVFWVVAEDSGASGDGFLLGDSGSSHFYRDTASGNIWDGANAHASILGGNTELNGVAVDGTATAMPTNLSLIALRTTGNVEANRLVRDQSINGRNWHGDIAELIVYNRQLTAKEMDEVGSYLTDKYDVEGALYGDAIDSAAFAKTMEISFPGYDRSTTLTNFPMLVVLGQHLDDFDYADFASTNGYELRFTDSTGTNAIYHELDQWGGAITDAVGAWNFEGHADDVSVAGNGHDGTVNGAVYSGDTVTGDGQSLYFDGTGNYVLMSGFPGITGTTPRTISAWIRNEGQANGAIVQWGEDAAEKKWVFRVQTGNGQAGALRVEVNGGYIVGSTVINDSSWHHVAAVLPVGASDVTSIVLYVDGRREAISAELAKAVNTGSAYDFRVGTDTSSRHFKGNIDDVAVWDVALTDEEIAALFNNDNPPDLSESLSVNSYVWVRLPELRQGTTIHAYWGNASLTSSLPFYAVNGLVWDDDYLAVQHMADAGANDATINGTDGTVSGCMYATGPIGGGLAYDGGNDHVNYGDVAEMDTPSQMTFSTWFRRDVDDAGTANDSNHNVNNILIGQSHGTVNDNFELGTEGSLIELYLDTGPVGDEESTLTYDAGVQNGVWYYLALVYDANAAAEATLYFNGEPVTNMTEWTGPWDSSSTAELSLGLVRPDNQLWGDFQGLMDETRLSLTPRSADWIWAEYAMVTDGDFVEYGTTVEPGDFPHKMRIQFAYDKGETLTNFPVLVKLEENTNLRYADFGSANGGDLRFAEENGTTLLYHEVERWDTNGTSYVWVNVETFTNNCTIWAYWGNSSYESRAYMTNGVVWNDGYYGVYHLHETSGTHYNANDRGLDLVVSGSYTQDSEGTIDGADYGTGGNNNQRLEPTNVGEPFFHDEFSKRVVSAWVTLDSTTGPNVVYEQGGSGNGMTIAYRTGAQTFVLSVIGGTGETEISGTSTFHAHHDTPIHVVGEFEDGTTRLYVNGVLDATGAHGNATIPYHSDNPGIGGSTLGTSLDAGSNENETKWHGSIDEVRISDASRSSNWIWAAYQNVGDYDTFVTMAPQVLASDATLVSVDSARAKGELVWADGGSADVTLYYGTNDPGATATGWGETNAAVSTAVGTMYRDLTGLTVDTTYFYRFYATNGAGDAWSEVAGFHTLMNTIDGLALWVNADAITDATNNGTVTTWRDLSGNGNHLVRSDGAPLLINNGVNGRDVVRFDGADNNYFVFDTIADIRTVIMVLKEDHDADGIRPILGDVAFSGATSHFHRDTTTNGYIFHGGNAHDNVLDGTTLVNGTEVDPTTTEMPTNMAILVVQTAGDVTANSLASDRRYASRTWDGDIAEVMIYDRALTLNEINEIGQHLESKYGITSSYEDQTLDPANFANRMKIRFSGYSGGSTLTNFPTLVRLGEHIGGFGYDAFESAVGMDLRFADDSGTRSLPFEIEEWNSNGYSYVWVSVPELETNTVIWAYWGNADTNAPYGYGTAVWDGDFDAVWHMRDDLLDGTVHDIDGTGTNLTREVGMISDAQDFNGVDSQVLLGTHTRLEHANTMTVEAWVNADVFDGPRRVFFKENDYSFAINGDKLLLQTWNEKNYETATGLLSLDTWHYVAAVMDGNNNTRLFIDGEFKNQVDYGSPGNETLSDAFLGRRHDGIQRFDGSVDELRISGTTRSDDWVQATYETVANNDAFMSYQLFVTADRATSIASTSATLEGTIHFTSAGPADVTLYYGTSDGGASEDGWGETNAMGSKSGTFTTDITGLAEATTCYFRFFASNGTFQAWSGVQVFRTAIDDVSGVALWLDAVQIGGKSDGQGVGVWQDLSGNGNHAIQLLPSMQPEYSAAVCGGKPAVTFGPGETMPLPSDVVAQGATVFIIHRQSIYQGAWTSPLGGDLRTTQDDQEWSLERTGGGTIWIRPQITSTEFSVNVLQLVQNDYRMWINGELIDASTSGDTLQPFDEVGFDFEGDIAEVIVFSRTLSLDEQNAVGRSLASKYGMDTGYEDTTLNPAQFNYRTPIAFAYDKGDTLTNFPVYVELSSSVVPGFNTNQFASSHGYDLRFTDETRTNMLSFEVEQWLWATPIAYYRFESNLVDSTVGGRTYNGTAQGVDLGYTNETPGAAGYALDISSPSGPYFDVQGWRGMGRKDARSITAWIKTTANDAGIAAWGEDAGGQKWIFRVQDDNGTPGAIRVEINGGYVVGSTPVNDGNWHFVACVLPEGGSDSLDIELYVDGQLETKSAIDQQALDTDVVSGINMRFGSDHSGRKLLGLMDDVAIWDVALTDAQMVTLYNGGTPENIASGIPDGDTLYAWVQVPAFTNNTRIWAHWGNASETDLPIFGADGAAWNEDYEVVWHLNGAGMDSTANRLHGGANEGNPVRTNGIAYDGTWFDDSDGQDKITRNGPYVFTNYTVSIWAKALSIPDHMNRSVFNADGTGNDFQFDFTSTDASANYRVAAANGGNHTFGPIALSNWVQLALSCDGTTSRCYYNGELKASFVGVNDDFTLFQVGCNRDEARHFPGVADEFRLLAAPASSNWIWASYIMLASNDTYVTYGEAEGPAPVITNVTAILVTDTNATFRGDLSVTDDVPTQVWVVWDTNNHSWGAWPNTNDFGGNNASGPLATNITGLSETQEYFYAYYASNVFGQTYAQPSMVFTTLQGNFYTIAPTSGLWGAISPDYPENVTPGDNSSEYTFTADPGFHLTNVMINNGAAITNLGMVGSHTFTNVNTNWAIEAQFGIDHYTITVNQVAGGMITPDPAEQVAYTNDSQVFTATPLPGYYLDDLLVDGASQGPVSTYQFVDVTTNHELQASFLAYPDASFPSNSLAFWIDADKLDAGDGDRVGQWYDMSGHATHLLQGVLLSQPQYATNSPGVLNGKPVVRFDGTHRMTTDVVNANWPVTNVTIFAVTKSDPVSQNSSLFYLVPNVSANRFLTHVPTGDRVYFDFGNLSTSGRVQTASFPAGTNYSMWTFGSEYAVGQEIRLNGSIIAADASSDDITLDGRSFDLGTASFQGDVAELLVFNEVLDYVDQQRVGHYLETKYGISSDYEDPDHVDIGVLVTTDAEYPLPGVVSSTFTYTISITNNGPTNATSVVITNVLQAGVIHVSDDGGGTFTPASGLWNVGNVAYLGGETLTITCRLAAGTGDQILTNASAFVSAGEPDWNGANDSDTAAFRANHEPIVAGDFLRKMKVSFPGYTKPETLTNFAALVKLHEGLTGFRYDDFVSATGGDLRFTTSDGETTLGYEVEDWDDSGTSYAWVTVPELAMGTYIWAYWGSTNDATAPAYTTNGLAWRGDYVTVSHLHDGNADDSSMNGVDGTVTDATADDGQIAGGLSFDGVDDYVDFGDIADMGSPGVLTASLWFRRRSDGTAGAHGINNVLVSKGHTTNNDNFELGTTSTNIEFYIDDGDPDGNPDSIVGGIQDDTWHHLALAYRDVGTAGAEAMWYVDGVLVSEFDTLSNGSGWAPSAGSPVGLGVSRVDTDRTGDFDGLMDEFRLSLVQRSSNWIWACVMNQGSSTYGSFVSAEEALGPPLLENLAASGVGRYGGTFRGEMISTGGAPTTVWLYYGTNDELDVAAAWENTNSLGIHGVGVLETNITGLAAGTTNYYRFFASNTYGTAWAEPSTNFRTADTNEFSITALVTGDGQILPNGVDYVLLGGNSANYTFSAGLGYRLTNVIVDTVSQGVIANYQFTNVSTDHTIHAYFGLDVYDVTITQATGGMIAPSPHDPIVYGSTSQVFTISANAGYYVRDVLVDGVPQGQIFTYQFTNVTNDHTITAVFSNAPALPVTDGAVLWLASDTVDATNNETITFWQDMTTNGHHVTQGDPGLAPSFVTNALNGRPALFFASSGEYLQRSDALGFSGAPAISVVAVVKGPNSDAHRFLQIGDAVGAGGRIISYGTDAAIRFNDGNRIMNPRQTGSYSIGMWTRTAGATYSASQYSNNGTVGSQRSTSGTSLVGLEDERTRVGAGWNGSGILSEALDGHMVELIVYDRALSVSEQDEIGRYLGERYRISNEYGSGLLPESANDPILFLSATEIDGATNNQPIETWTDLSGHWNDVTQVTPASQPVFKTGALNGQPALYFNSDYLRRTDSCGFVGNTEKLTVFVVCNSAATGTDKRFLQMGKDTGVDKTNIAFAEDSSVRYNGGNREWLNDKMRGAFFIGCFVRGDNLEYQDVEFYRNGFLATQSSAPVNGTKTLEDWESDETLVGAGRASNGTIPSNVFNGHICELIVYDRELSAPQLQDVGNYLMNRYKLFPTTFMFK